MESPGDERLTETVPPAVLVLGPCIACTDDGLQPSLSTLQRRLLTRLALAAPSSVDLGDLIDALWPDDPPRTARAALQNQVSRTRRLLGDHVIATVDTGYALGVPTDVEVLTDRIERAEVHLAHAEPEPALDLLDRALDLWRGPPFGDLDHLVDVDADRQRLVLLRTAAETLRLRTALALGRTTWALTEAERLVDDDPLDEQRWALLIRALDQAGRRGDALGAFDRARTTLRRELGIDPGPALRAAEAAVLGTPTDDRSLGRQRLVERRAELDTLRAAVEGGGLTFLVGEDGAGKSVLLDELARRVRTPGTTVGRARCPRSPSRATVTLLDLLESIGSPLDRNAGVVEGFVAAVRGLTTARRVVLLVDDFHLAGPTTRRALEACADLPGVALVATTPGDPAGGSEVASTVVTLAPLTDEQIAQLASAHLGRHLAPDHPLVGELSAMSGGNPLFAESLLADRELVERWSTDADEHRPGPPPAPPELSDLVRTRLERLGVTTSATIETAAVCGPELPRDLLAALTSPSQVEAALATGLLERDGDTVWFRHGAVQRVVYSDLAPGRRMEIHYTAAAALRAQDAPAAVVAPHALAAVELDPRVALEAARAAAVEATNQGAHRDAALWYERAIEAAAALGSGGIADRVVSLIGLGDALRLAGDARHEEVLFHAVELADRVHDVDLLGEAAFALLQLGATTETGSLHERASALADRVMAATDDPERRAVIAAASSLAHSMSGHPDRCRELFLRAEADARSDEARRKVLPFAFLALGRPGDLDLRERLADELVRRAEPADDAIARFEALHLQFSVGLQRADGAKVRRSLTAMEALVDRVGDIGRRWALGYQSAAVAHLDDELDQAEQLAEDAMALFAPVSGSRAFAVYGSQLLVLRLAQGRIAELADVMAGLVADQPGVPAWHAALALTLAADDPSAAAHHATAALDDVPDDFTWLAGHVIGGRAAALACDRAAVDEYRRRLAPWSGLVCWQGTCAYGPVDTPLAALAHAAGDDEAAEHHRTIAVERARSLGAPVFERELDELCSRW